MSLEQTIHGKIIYGPEAEIVEGYIVVEEGIIKEVHEKKTESSNIIAPCFINAHTHIGDSVCKDPALGDVCGHYVQRNLSKLVQPPNGLKHRILKNTPQDKLVGAMGRTLMDMYNTGTCAFADFREGGLNGVLALRKALESCDIECKIFGRPSSCATEGNITYEIDNILSFADGLGMSGANDIDMYLLKDARRSVSNTKKRFAIHAGESSTRDIENALSLDPDILIHMTKARQSHIKKLHDMDIPVIVCPRSNFITGVGMPPVIEMLDAGVKVAVGTDNVMLNSVNMFAEMELLSKVFGIDDRQVFMMCTLMGATILGLKEAGTIQEGNKAKVMIINGNSDNLTGIRDPLSGIVRRGRPDDILSVIV